MAEATQKLQLIAESLSGLCRHVSIRQDSHENFILAVSLNDDRSLDIREVNGRLRVEFWNGNSHHEVCAREESFLDLEKTISEARSWLST